MAQCFPSLILFHIYMVNYISHHYCTKVSESGNLELRW